MSAKANSPSGPKPLVIGELVMDAGPLNHFAKAGWLGVLRFVADGAQVVITDIVEAELRTGAHTRPHLQTVLDSDWIERRVLSSLEELGAYGKFSSRLVGADGRNAGEASVLAYAQVHRMIAVIDDGAGRKAGKTAEVQVRGTLGLLMDAIRSGQLTVEMVSQVADDLLATQYRLPFVQGEFAQWARQQGLK